jgi:hypothetical protein
MPTNEEDDMTLENIGTYMGKTNKSGKPHGKGPI